MTGSSKLGSSADEQKDILNKQQRQQDGNAGANAAPGDTKNKPENHDLRQPAPSTGN